MSLSHSAINIQTTEGIVLKSFEYKEKERVITLFSQSEGLMSLIIKRLSPRTLRLLALTTPFCRAEYLFVKGLSDLYRFHDGTLLDAHTALRSSLDSLKAAGDMTRALLHSQLPGKPAPLLYALLSSSLRNIPLFTNPAILSARFYLTLLHHEGLIAEQMIKNFFNISEIAEVRELLHATHFSRLAQKNFSQDLVLRKIPLFFETIFNS